MQTGSLDAKKRIPRPDFRRARAAARQLFQQAPAFPVDVLKLLKNHPLVCDVLFLGFGQSVDGMVVAIRETAGYVVVLNRYYADGDEVMRRRLRWTVAHELGHIALNHLFRFPEYEQDPEQHKAAEQEAHVFAEELLMPGWAMLRFPDLTPSVVADFFGVSVAAAERRIQRYGFYALKLYENGDLPGQRDPNWRPYQDELPRVVCMTCSAPASTEPVEPVLHADEEDDCPF